MSNLAAPTSREFVFSDNLAQELINWIKENGITSNDTIKYMIKFDDETMCVGILGTKRLSSILNDIHSIYDKINANNI